MVKFVPFAAVLWSISDFSLTPKKGPWRHQQVPEEQTSVVVGPSLERESSSNKFISWIVADHTWDFGSRTCKCSSIFPGLWGFLLNLRWIRIYRRSKFLGVWSFWVTTHVVTEPLAFVVVVVSVGMRDGKLGVECKICLRAIYLILVCLTVFTTPETYNLTTLLPFGGTRRSMCVN